MRLFDLHCDTLYECVQRGMSILQNDGQVDIARGRVFSPWYQCFAAWVPDNMPDAGAAALTDAVLRQAQRFEAAYPADFHLLQSGGELAFPPQSICTAILTVENAGAAAGGDAFPDAWCIAGVRMATLTWNGANRWATGCMGDPHGGLTPAGREAVRQMEAAGILPDAAHLNRRGFFELADMLIRPFTVSHTASAALQPCPRNLTDEQFLLVKARGGVVGVDLCAAHLGAKTLDRFIAHLEHFLALDEHTVGLGCDLDGISLPPEWQGMRILETLYDKLRQRNYAESLIDDIFFGNAYRFFEKNIS